MNKYEVKIRTVAGDGYETEHELEGSSSDLLESMLEGEVYGFIPYICGCKTANKSVYLMARNIASIEMTEVEK